jgi:hypothetical protein
MCRNSVIAGATASYVATTIVRTASGVAAKPKLGLMKTICCALLIGVGAGFSGAVLAGPLGAPGVPPISSSLGSIVETVQYLPGSGFRFPRAGGAIVDWCRMWATDCGEGGARQFCRSKGFDRALSWDVYFAGRTYVIGSDRFCEGGACRGFRFVRCG